MPKTVLSDRFQIFSPQIAPAYDCKLRLRIQAFPGSQQHVKALIYGDKEMKKILVVSSFPAPYRVAVFEGLAAYYQLDVFFEFDGRINTRVPIHTSLPITVF